MKNLVFFFVLGAFFELNAMRLETWQDACSVGYVLSTELLPKTYQQHCQNNQEQIKLCLTKPVNKILVLGPAPGHDLPLGNITTSCDQLIFLGAGMDEFEERMGKKISSKQGSPISYKTVDLTGGFYDLLGSNKMASILLNVYQDFLNKNKIDYAEMERYLEANLSLNLAPYEATTVISSLVTSQLYAFASNKFAHLAATQVLSLCRSLKSTMDQDECKNKLKPLLQSFHGKNAAIVERAYYNGLLASLAETVYFSDTYFPNGFGLVHEELQGFIAAMQKQYRIESGISAWPFQCVGHDNVPVSWYRFTKNSSN